MRERLLTLLFLMQGVLFLQAADEVKDVTLEVSGMNTTMTNGLIEVKINSNGQISLLKANGINAVGSNTVYFDYTASDAGLKGEPLRPSKVEIVRQEADYAEVLYSNTMSDLRFQQGFIMRKGIKGIYSYVIANGTPTSSNILVQEARVCGRLGATFIEGYVDDQMRGTMPSNEEMAVAEQEENTIQDATYKLADGSVYTKYNWAQYVVRDSVHGLMDKRGYMGVWNIHCATEWYPGGPMKQELTAHATSKSPITIQMLQGEHFGTQPVVFKDGERKLYGPFLIYVNFDADKNFEHLIADAKQMAHQQQEEWPFQWFKNELFPLDRSTVNGRLQVTTGQACDSIQVVLAEPGELYVQNKGYMFWALTDAQGQFSIKNVRKGTYTLHAYATKGDVTDELEQRDIVVDGSTVDLGTIDWTPLCYETKLFQIGENNRMSDGFKLSDLPRAYGMWERVPSSLTYTVGTSNPQTNWYYGQVNNGTWTVVFNSDETFTGTAHLTISAAGVGNSPRLAISLNGNSTGSWSPSPNDASVYRSALLGGRHRLHTFDFPATRIKKGQNKLTLTMSGIGKNGGILYDCIKLEAGNRIVSSINEIAVGRPVNGGIEVYNLRGQRLGSYGSAFEAQRQLPHGVYICRQPESTKKVVW